jgi:hypothetical protein
LEIKAEHPGNYSIMVEAEGIISGYVGGKPDVGPDYEYEDRIGGYGSAFVNAEVASHIYIDSIQPAEGAPGTRGIINGGGATPNGTVVALLSGPVNQTVVIGSNLLRIQENFTILVNMTLGWTVADANGFWSIPFTVPKVSPGEYTIYVIDNGTLTSDSAKFNVLPATPTQIKIEYVSPAEGYPGTRVFIAGHGATPKGRVEIYFGRLNVANTVALGDGGWSASFNVPDVSPGNYTILALDVISGTSDRALFNVLETTPRNVGVKEGDWAKYNITVDYSTNDPNPPIILPSTIVDLDYLMIKIVSVAKTNVTYEFVLCYKNGTEQKSISWMDIATGLTCPGFTMSYGPIIASNLTAGDKVYLNYYAPTINSTFTALYAGLEREVNSLRLKSNITLPTNYKSIAELTINWDKVSGILCEQRANASYINMEKGYETNMFLRAVILETNIWIKPSVYMFNVTWENETYPIIVLSNSTVSNITFNQSKAQICLTITGSHGTKGYCNITIPKDLLRGPWTYIMEGEKPTIMKIEEGENETCSFICFTYIHSSTFQIIIQGIWVIMEFPSTITPSLIILSTGGIVFLIRKLAKRLE